MNKEKVIWGIILFGVGLILLLNNMDMIDFHWRAVFRMWPLVIIIVGINLLLSRSVLGKTISVLVTIACIAFLAYVGISSENVRGWGFRGNDRGVTYRSDNDRGRIVKNIITHEYDGQVKTAKLNIRGGAVEYEIESPDDNQLFWSEIESVIGGHELNARQINDSSINLSFMMKERLGKKDWNFRNDRNEAKIRLHPDPIWTIEIGMGAGTADFDLRKYKISRLDMNCGAASVEIKLGSPVGHSEVKAEVGAASLEIELPESAACRIVTSSALSSRDFKGFVKQGDGSYTTPGYTEEGDRYTFHLKGGVSSFTVRRKAD